MVHRERKKMRRGGGAKFIPIAILFVGSSLILFFVAQPKNVDIVSG